MNLDRTYNQNGFFKNPNLLYKIIILCQKKYNKNPNIFYTAWFILHIYVYIYIYSDQTRIVFSMMHAW